MDRHPKSIAHPVCPALALGCALALLACSDDATSSSPDAGAGQDASSAGGSSLPARSDVALPDGEAGVGLDDLQYSALLDRVIVPAGRAGYVGLVDPQTEEVEKLGDFSQSATYEGGHDFGTTSAIEVDGLIYAVDRTTMELHQLDPADGTHLAAIPLGAAPDYVRYVQSTRELWVTQPASGRFQIFTLGDEELPSMTDTATMAIAGGPESFVLNEAGTVGYTNTFLGSTLRIDVASREVTDTWDNTCNLSLGIALDEGGQRIFVGCTEGKAVVLDLADAGAVVSTLAVGTGVDIISFSPELDHLYLNGSSMGQLTIAAVSDAGELSEQVVLETAPSTNSSCVLGDPYGNVWVCNANAGELFRITDTY